MFIPDEEAYGRRWMRDRQNHWWQDLGMQDAGWSYEFFDGSLLLRPDGRTASGRSSRTARDELCSIFSGVGHSVASSAQEAVAAPQRFGCGQGSCADKQSAQRDCS
jgi:hypothetical protein